jgi:hypothetical protein
MFGMTLYKCGFSSLTSARQMPFITMFARDGILWFIAVLLITVTDIIIWVVGRPTMAETTVAMSCALYSIIASRALLNIKSTMSAMDNLTTMSLHNSTLNMQFQRQNHLESEINEDRFELREFEI